MLKYTITYIKSPRTMSDKGSEHVRHSQHATTKSEADMVAKTLAEMAAGGVGGSDGVAGCTG
jgi:hypothetical protein